MSENQKRLLNVIKLALKEYNANEFTYEWEWETFTMPTHTIYIDGLSIHVTYDIYFDFSGSDLDALEALGYFEKIKIKQSKFLTTIQYKISDV